MVGKSIRRFCLVSTVALLVAAWTEPAAADYAVNLPRGVTSISREAWRLHMLAFWVCVGIAVVVFGTLAWSVVLHRKSRGAVAARFHDNTKLEIFWTIVPVIVLVVLAVPGTRALVVMHDSADPDLTIKITGQQWRWRYEYLDHGVDFLSTMDQQSVEASGKGAALAPQAVEHYLQAVDNPLVLPVGRKIRFLTTATDVIHSWWVPALGFKKDAIPGFINEAWARIDEPGTYRGQCAELCGVGHAYMPIVVVAKAAADFDAWLADTRAKQTALASAADRVWTREELYAAGEGVYQRFCVACHQANGQGLPGVFPALAGSAVATGPVAVHLDRVMNGKPGTAMQAFAPQLSDADIAAVVTYERNAWGNEAGDLVQPSEVRQARKKE